ncbi:hypothetical protein [Propionivibrio sp.]|uniref:hypothetical protein n=1 Tax=Propionivibrio sp. TaxID=2212460 RepID=UPI003BF15275
MNEIEPNNLIGIISGIAGALISIGVGAREYMKRERMGNASQGAEIRGIAAGGTILENLVKEVERLSKRIEALEKQVSELTDKLANVRMIAVDCYSLAVECQGDKREQLLEHIKQIIKDA